MIAQPFLAFVALLAVGVTTALHGVVREDKLVLRWSFDEGVGSNSQNLVGTGLDVVLQSGATWGNEQQGTAKSLHSLDLSTGSAYASAMNDTRLQARENFSYLFWFKSNGVPNEYSQLLSKRTESYSSYFVQIEPGGESLKSILRLYGTYHDTGSIAFDSNQWHMIASTFDGEVIATFLDGKLINENEQSDPVFVEQGALGIGGTADGGSLFNGWIDDLRFYDVALSASDVKKAYGNGMGDFGPLPDFSAVDRSPLSMPMSGVKVVFRDSSGLEASMTGFDQSDLETEGATVSNFQSISPSTYSFDLDAYSKPQRILINIAAGAAKDDQNISSSQNSITLVYGDVVTRSEDLVGWWKFDQHVIQQDEGNDFNESWTPSDLSVPPLLWLDANDSSTFEFSSGYEVSKWKHKLDPNIYLEARGTQDETPTRDVEINGLAGVDFDVGDQLRSRINDQSDRNPLGANGELLRDSAVFIVYKLESNGLSQELFNNGADWKTNAPWNLSLIHI